MIIPATHLKIPQGTTWAHAWRVSGVDFTDATWHAESQIRHHVDSHDVLHDFKTSDTITFEGGVVLITLTPATTSAWTWHRGVYDVEIHSDDGRVYRVAQGPVTLLPEVTR